MTGPITHRSQITPLPDATVALLRNFYVSSRFATQGGIVTDLDGTALAEREGRLFVADAVTHGLKSLVEQGRPIVINTLRFPLNVIETFGREWTAITAAPIPLVSLNGSTIGMLNPTSNGHTGFEEVASFPLSEAEIAGAIETLELLIAGGIEDIIVFHYAADWLEGETIWTPTPGRVSALSEKYRSASRVWSGAVAELRDTLLSRRVCMLSVLVDLPEDRRMAYQHANPNRFVTAAGVDKLFGASEAAKRLNFDLGQSVGAGDTPMDTFLSGVGLSLQVGPLILEHKGRIGNLSLRDPSELGAALFALAAMDRVHS